LCLLLDAQLSATVGPPAPPSSLLSHAQEWKFRYLLSKARRVRDAAQSLAYSQVINITSTVISQAPAYVASRVGEGAALPEVEVEGGQGEGEGGAVEGGLVVREAVVRHVVEGIRTELFRELMEEVVGV
jgi:hypothetical protein